LDLGGRGAAGVDKNTFVAVSELMKSISSTLLMLDLVDASEALNAQVGQVCEWSNEGDLNTDKEEFCLVADALLFVESSIASLQVSTPVSQMANGEGAGSENSVSVSYLDGACRLVLRESRNGFSLVKRAITSFIDSNGDKLHLQNIPVTLTAIGGGLIFVNMDRAASVVKSCKVYVEERLLVEESNELDAHLLETLADAITSVDYYLESIESNRPMGDGILEVAEESIDELKR